MTLFRLVVLTLVVAFLVQRDETSILASTAGRNGLIAFVQEGFEPGNGPYLYVTDPATGNKSRIVADMAPSAPAWSPDGRMLAFVGGSDDVPRIYVINADGTNLRQVARGGENSLSWSLDSTRIAYERPSPINGSSQLRIVSVWSLAEATIYESIEVLDDVQWAPGGESLTFRSDLYDTHQALFAIDVDGNNLRRIGLQVAFGYEWSPDGRRIAYSGYSGVVSEENLDIFVAFADGTGDVNLTNTPEDEAFPHWSPDGNLVAYTIETSPPELRVVKADGTDLRVIATNAGDGLWSPDSRKMAYAVDRFDSKGEYAGVELHVLDLFTDEERNLTPNADYGGGHVWQRLPEDQPVVVLPPGVPVAVPPATGDGGLLTLAAQPGGRRSIAVGVLVLVALLAASCARVGRRSS